MFGGFIGRAFFLKNSVYNITVNVLAIIIIIFYFLERSLCYYLWEQNLCASSSSDIILGLRF